MPIEESNWFYDHQSRMSHCVRQCYDLSRVSHDHQMLNQLLVDKIIEAFDLRMAENVLVDSVSSESLLVLTDCSYLNGLFFQISWL
jgi:hypothetical protein